MKTHHSIGRLWIENHDKYQNYFNGNGGDKIYWLGHNGRKEEISKTDPRIDEELRKYGIRPCGGVSARRLVSPLWGLHSRPSPRYPSFSGTDFCRQYQPIPRTRCHPLPTSTTLVAPFYSRRPVNNQCFRRK